MRDPAEKLPVPFASEGLSIRFRPRRRRRANQVRTPSFRYPYDLPNEIVYKELDQMGRALIKEINLHPWMESTDYCAGHPPDRPAKESTPLSLLKAGSPKMDALRWDFFEELAKLKQRSKPGDKYYTEVRRLGDQSRSRFYLNLNLYLLPPFLNWARRVDLIVSRIFVGGLPIYRLPEVQFHPSRPGLNVTWSFDYYSVEDRRVFHQILLDTLQGLPI